MPTMRKLFCSLLLLLPLPSFAQLINRAAQSVPVPLQANHWQFKEGKVAFMTHKARPAMKITLDQTNVGPVLLKDFEFRDGTIEYDVELLQNKAFAPIYFRWQDSGDNECFYLRNYRAGNPKAHDAVQYAPTVKGVWLWDLFYEYQAKADFKLDQWNHIKLVMAGGQMRVYVNNPTKPVLVIPRLEADAQKGSIGFDGNVIIANLIVKPNQVEGLTATQGVDILDNDARYLREWQVSKPLVAPKGVDYSADWYPTPETTWDSIEAERKGMVNLSRRFGKSDSRRMVWLKTTITSAAAQPREVALGFSDDVWVFLNGKLVYVDKNTYTMPIRKEPDGRISVENATLRLSLQPGDNELLIGVANDIFGWGLIARLALKESDLY